MLCVATMARESDTIDELARSVADVGELMGEFRNVELITEPRSMSVYETPTDAQVSPKSKVESPPPQTQQLTNPLPSVMTSSSSNRSLGSKERFTSGSFASTHSDGFQLGIGIQVHMPELRTRAFKNYHAYRVTSPHNKTKTEQNVHEGMEYEVFRRYQDFVWLRAELVRQYPGIFIPPLPPKKLIGNTEQMFVNERMRVLNRFLNLCEASDVRRSQAFSLFLTEHDDEAFASKNALMTKQTQNELIEDTLRRMRAMPSTQHTNKLNFPSSVIAPVDLSVVERLVGGQRSVDWPAARCVQLSLGNTETDERVLKLKAYIEQIEAKLASVSFVCDTMCMELQAVADTLNQMNSGLQKLYDLETEHPDLPRRPDFTDCLLQLQLQTKQASTSHQVYLSRTLRLELWDCRSFLDVIESQQAIAKKNAKSKKERESEGDQYITPDFEAEIEDNNMSQLLQIVSCHVLTNQLKTFWEQRMQRFRTNIHLFAAEQAEIADQEIETWAELLSKVE